MNFTMKCRIDETEFYNGKHYTTVQTAAPDLYSKPSSYRLQSQQPLGSAGNEITVDIAISGNVFKRPYVDKSTGQQKQYVESKVYFDAQIAQAKPVRAAG